MKKGKLLLQHRSKSYEKALWAVLQAGVMARVLIAGYKLVDR